MPIFVAQMSMSLLIKPIMAEDALFAFIPGYPVRRVSRRPAAPSLRCWDSYLTHDAGGRFFFDFEAIRTESSDCPESRPNSLEIQKETTHDLVWWTRRASTTSNRRDTATLRAGRATSACAS